MAKRSRHFTQHACRALYSEKSRAFGQGLKQANVTFMLAFTKLVNKLFQSGKFPEEWVYRDTCSSSFKEGDEKDLNNYRGITLLSIFGKFFLVVLLERFNNINSQFVILEKTR